MDQQNDDNDPVDFASDQLLVGDKFRNPEEDDDNVQEEEERRRKRRKRLDAIAAATQHNSNNKETTTADHHQPRIVQQDAANMNRPIIKSAIRELPEANGRDLTKNDEDIDDREGDDDLDEFDMFLSNSVSPLSPEPPPQVPAEQQYSAAAATTTAERGHEQQDWDDVEGYYKAVIGEELQLLGTIAGTTDGHHGQQQQQQPTTNNNINSSSTMVRLRVAGVIGKGVFSTVLKCTTISNNTSLALPPTVAIKCIRHNESMVKAATTELSILLKLKGSPGIVSLLLPTHAQATLDHRGHFIMVFSYMEYNLRDVLQKFGKGVGVSLQAVRSYYGQMIAAALHLYRHGIIHADLKPDNILVSNDFATIQLADFGSAYDVKESGADTIPTTPYLVSRFYRAPEIILGLKPTYAIDLWSLAVTVAELFLGDVLFRGGSNNDMLYVFMQTLGPIPNRIIRQHILQSKKFGLPIHFQQQPGGTYYFSQDTIDAVSGTKVHKLLSLSTSDHSNNNPQLQQQQQPRKFPNATPLATSLRKAQSQNDTRVMVDQFTDLLKQCLHLDPTRRIALHDALRHAFFATASATTSST